VRRDAVAAPLIELIAELVEGDRVVDAFGIERNGELLMRLRIVGMGGGRFAKADRVEVPTIK
jgi:hypothetical protein